MAILTVQKISLAGLKPAYQAAAVAGDEFENNGKTFYHVKNGSATAKAITFDSVKPCDQGFDHDVVVNIPAGEERLLGPFAPERFNNQSRQVKVTYSSVDLLTVAAISV